MKLVKQQKVYPIRLDQSDYERLRIYAAERDLTAAQVIRAAIRRIVQRTPGVSQFTDANSIRSQISAQSTE
jgi:hypothetical protein